MLPTTCTPLAPAAAAKGAPAAAESAFAQGGHFAALEQPQLLFDDLMAFVDKVKSQL
jgi:hypothetical protein